jgi:hypothetical protein
MEQSRDAIKAVDSALISIKTAWQQISVAMAPVIKYVANFVQELVEKLQPHIPQIASAFMGFAEVAVAVVRVLIDAVGELFSWFGKLIDSWFGFSEGAKSARDIVLNVFQAIGVAGAYVWDTMNAGAGAVTLVLGKIVLGVGFVVEAFSELVALAKELPDVIKPAWVDKFADSCDRAQKAVKDTGRDMSAMGLAAINNFGKSADSVRKFFDGIRNGETAPKISGIKLKPIEYKPAAAVLKDSREAYSAEVAFTEKFKLRENPQLAVANKQLAAAVQGNQILGVIAKNGVNVPIFKIGAF